MVKAHPTPVSGRKQAGKRPVKKIQEREPTGYRVGCVRHSRILWAYDEVLTFREAQEIAASSRLTKLAPGVTPGRLLPLSPAAVQRLKSLRDNVQPAITLDVYVVLTAKWKVLTATHCPTEAAIYKKSYDDYHSANGLKATIRQDVITI